MSINGHKEKNESTRDSRKGVEQIGGIPIRGSIWPIHGIEDGVPMSMRKKPKFTEQFLAFERFKFQKAFTG